MTTHKGLRYNHDKVRYDLLPPRAIEGLARVLTHGANKYEPRNWEKGMAWSTVLASIKRHIAAFEMGEDFDKESSLLHINHVLCNAAFLSEYYSIYPQGDDRTMNTIRNMKIGLDVDDVLSDFINAYCVLFDMAIPDFWCFDPNLEARLKTLYDDFWLNLPVKNYPDMMNFEPHIYITSRKHVSREVTMQWLISNGFPDKPLFIAESPEHKAVIAKENNVDIFIDDSYNNYLAMHRHGVFCYLYTANHNQRFDVGHRRICSLML